MAKAKSIIELSNSVGQAGTQMTGDQLAALLQAIKESSGIANIDNLITFTPTITSETLNDFIIQTLTPEALKKIQFGVINIASHNDNQFNSIIPDKYSSSQTQINQMSGEHWVSYIQIPNLFDADGNVVSVSSIILNSAGENYVPGINELKRKVEEIFVQHNIQLTLTVLHLNYQVQDLEQHQDWNTCGIWTSYFFEQTIEKIVKAETPAEVNFVVLTNYIDIATKRKEYTEWLKAVELSMSTPVIIKNDNTKTVQETSISKEEHDVGALIKQTVNDGDFDSLYYSVLSLAQIYEDKQQYVEACGLYNYALNLCTLKSKQITGWKFKRQEIQTKLAQIEADFLMNLGLNVADKTQILNFHDLNAQHRVALHSIRKYATKKIKNLSNTLKISTPNYSSNLDGVIEDTEELIKAEQIQYTYSKIVIKLKKFIKNLIRECQQKLGKESCEFAILGLGSMAREEMTPYSDFEWMILIQDQIPILRELGTEEYEARGSEYNEKNKEYFGRLTQFLQLKVINFGETILPSLAIKSLNDYLAEVPTDWFFDNITPRGFSFDGLMPHACKWPLGRKTIYGNNNDIIQKGFELIGTPDELSLYQNSALYTFEDQLHLREVLTNAVFITGSEEIANKYLKEVSKQILNLENHVSLLAATGLKLLQKSVEEFDTKLGEPNQEGKLFDVKKEVYRLPSILIDGLAMLNNIAVGSTWNKIIKLKELDVINYKAEKNLKIALSIAMELRLRAYLFSHSQKEPLSIFQPFPISIEEQKNFIKKIFCIADISILFRFYYTALPLQLIIKDYIKDKSIQSIMLFNNDFYDYSYRTRGLVYLRLLQYEKALSMFELAYANDKDSYQIRQLLSSSYSRLGHYAKALSYLEAIALDSITQSCAESINIDKAKLYECLGDYDEAEIIYNNIISNSQNLLNIAIAHSGLGIVYGKQSREWVEKASQQFNLALNICKDQRSSVLISVINNLAVEEGKLGNNDMAISLYQKGLRISLSAYELIHPKTLKFYSNMATEYLFKNKKDPNKEYINRALKYYSDAIGINKRLFGDTSNEAILDIYFNIAGIYYYNLEEYTEALEYYKKANSVLIDLSWDIKVTERAFTILANISKCFFKKGEYSLALEWSQKAKLVETTDISLKSEIDALTKRLAIMLTLQMIQVNNLEKALDFYKLYNSKITTVKEIASSLFQLGKALEKKKSYSLALECILGAKKLYKALNSIPILELMRCESSICSAVVIEIKDIQKVVATYSKYHSSDFSDIFTSHDEATDSLLEALKNKKPEIAFKKSEDVLRILWLYPNYVLFIEYANFLMNKNKAIPYVSGLTSHLIFSYLVMALVLKDKPKLLYKTSVQLNLEEECTMERDIEQTINTSIDLQILLAEVCRELGISEENSQFLKKLQYIVLGEQDTNALYEEEKSWVTVFQEARAANNICEQIEALNRLAETYIKIGQSGVKENKNIALLNLNKALALYKYIIAFCKANERSIEPNYLNEKILELENTVFILANIFVGNLVNGRIFDKVAFEEENKRYKQVLIDLRQWCRDQLNQLNTKHYSELARSEEIAHSESIRSIYIEITNRIKSLIVNMLEDCKSIIGPAKCTYTIVGLGSMAREEMTPYSDLEWAILIEEGQNTEENKQYFRDLANLLHFKIINLGETILPAMNIESLKGLSDFITPRGFAFDSFSLGACKTSLGNMHLQNIAEKDRFELIKTPEEMASFLSNENTIDTSWHLDKVLSTHTFIFSNSNQDLYNEYKENIKLILDSNFCQERGKIYLLEQAGSNVVRVGTHTTEGRMLDIKYTFYRIPTLQLDALSYLYKLQSRSTIDRLEELSTVSIFDNEEVKEFFIQIGNILASIQLLRLKNYLKHNKQDDHIIDKDMLQLLESFNLSQDKMHWMLQSLLTFADLMVHFIEVEKIKKIKESEDLSEDLARLSITEVIKSKLIDYHMLNSIYAYEKLEMFEEAEKQCKRLIKKLQEVKDFEGEVEIATQLAKIYSKEGLGGQEQKIISLLQPIYNKLKNSNEKIEINELQKHSIRIKHIIEFLSNLGGAYFTIDVNKSKTILEQARDLLEEYLRNLSSNNNDNELSFIKASILNEYGRALCETGEGTKAVELVRESIQITEEKFGQAHQDLALRYNNLGQALTSISDYENAIIYYEKAITILLSNRVINNNIVTLIYINLSEAYLNIEKPNFTKGKEFIDKAEEVYKVLPEESDYLQLKYYFIAQKAVVCNALGEYTKATEYYLEAWKLVLQIDNAFSYRKLSILTEFYIAKQIEKFLESLKNNSNAVVEIINLSEGFLGKVDFLKYADSIGLLFLIGRYYFYNGESEYEFINASEYYTESIKFLQKAKNKICDSTTVNEKFQIYQYLGHVYKAIAHIEISNNFMKEAAVLMQEEQVRSKCTPEQIVYYENYLEKKDTSALESKYCIYQYLKFKWVDCSFQRLVYIPVKGQYPIITKDRLEILLQYDENGSDISVILKSEISGIDKVEELIIQQYKKLKLKPNAKNIEIEINYKGIKKADLSNYCFSYLKLEEADLTFEDEEGVCYISLSEKNIILLNNKLTEVRSESLHFVKEQVYDNLLLQHPKLLILAYEYGGIKTLNLLIKLGEEKDIAAQILEEIEDQSVEAVLSTLFVKQEESKDQSEVVQKSTSDSSDSLLSMIDKIKGAVSENEANSFWGFSQYVMNALGHNPLTTSAQRMIKAMSDSIENLEYLLDASMYGEDEVISYDSYITAVWLQLENLFEYVESGQRMMFYSRPPYFDPDDFDGGFGSGYRGSNENDNEIDPYVAGIVPIYNNTNIVFIGENSTSLEHTIVK